jgi:hypothetical protein
MGDRLKGMGTEGPIEQLNWTATCLPPKYSSPDSEMPLNCWSFYVYRIISAPCSSSICGSLTIRSVEVPVHGFTHLLRCLSVIPSAVTCLFY